MRKEIEKFNLVIAGVGGQGTILASRIVATTAIRGGFRVRVGETYGAAQRGGPVMSHIRIGSSVNSPFICPDEADVLLGFEPAEARRTSKYLKKGGLAIINIAKVYPVEVITGAVEYPPLEDLTRPIETIARDAIVFDATDLAKKAGNPVAMNVVMLGALAASDVLPFPEKHLREELKDRIPKKFLELNVKAYEFGFNKVKENSSGETAWQKR